MTKSDVRLFAPFPIEMDEHPKIIGLSDAAFRGLFEATFYSRRMMSDGFIDERVVMKRWGLDVAAELSSNDPERPSWVRVESPKPGWQIHDFEKHHPLRADIEEKRNSVAAKRSEAGKRGNVTRWGADPVATESQTDRKSVATYRSETETETETETTSTDVDVVTRKRATRIPDPFIVDSAMRAWATERTPGVFVDSSTEKFVNYWRSKARDATKLDWIRTWRNWMITDFENLPQQRGAPPRKQTAAERAFALTEELRRERGHNRDSRAFDSVSSG